MLQLPEGRLPKLAAWLRRKSSMIQMLCLGLLQAQGGLSRVGPALQPLSRLTTLELVNLEEDSSQGPVTLQAATLDALRQLPLRR